MRCKGCTRIELLVVRAPWNYQHHSTFSTRSGSGGAGRRTARRRGLPRWTSTSWTGSSTARHLWGRAGIAGLGGPPPRRRARRPLQSGAWPHFNKFDDSDKGKRLTDFSHRSLEGAAIPRTPWSSSSRKRSRAHGTRRTPPTSSSATSTGSGQGPAHRREDRRGDRAGKHDRHARLGARLRPLVRGDTRRADRFTGRLRPPARGQLLGHRPRADTKLTRGRPCARWAGGSRRRTSRTTTASATSICSPSPARSTGPPCWRRCATSATRAISPPRDITRSAPYRTPCATPPCATPYVSAEICSRGEAAGSSLPGVGHACVAPKRVRSKTLIGRCRTAVKRV